MLRVAQASGAALVGPTKQAKELVVARLRELVAS
jgi:hypothetical protein